MRVERRKQSHTRIYALKLPLILRFFLHTKNLHTSANYGAVEIIFIKTTQRQGWSGIVSMTENTC